MLSVLACALALPASAAAAGSGGGGLSGGGSTGGTGTTTSTTPTTPVSTTPASQPVTVSSDGITLQTTSSALLRRQLSFSGTAPSAAGQTIEIDREGRATHGVWEPTVTATVGSNGSFQAVWHTSQVGRFALRAEPVSSASTTAQASAYTATAPAAPTLSVYRGARATIYGPGFYGRKTACGGRLRRSTIGVANRTLPCGTRVSLMYGGSELTVPVIDRGPYANGASWDVTMAAAKALGMNGTEWIGAIALPGRGLTPSALVGPALLR